MVKNERGYFLKMLIFECKQLNHNGKKLKLDFNRTIVDFFLNKKRMLKHAKSKITLKRAQELTKTMYQLVYRLPKSRLTKTKILKMDNNQQELYDMTIRWSKRK